MLIIFDLDDTLINTSGSITPALQQRALENLAGAGMEFTDFNAALTLFRSLDKNAPSSRHAIYEFLEIMEGLDHYDIAEETIYRPGILEMKVERLDYAKTLLTLLGKDHCLVLVTAGAEDVQTQKLELADIDKNFFDSIHFCPSGDKRPAYESLLEKFSLPAEEVVVCGDRIQTDLAPAKELGMNTIHMRFGRGLGNTGLKSDVDYTILRLEEMPMIIRRIENNL